MGRGQTYCPKEPSELLNVSASTVQRADRTANKNRANHWDVGKPNCPKGPSQSLNVGEPFFSEGR